MPTMTAHIDDVTVLREGETASGQPWTLYKVKAGGRELTTFDGKWTDAIGQVLEITYEEKKSDDGRYTNYRIIQPKKSHKSQGGGVPDALLTEVRDLLREIRDILAVPRG